jgi:hypothetical protein
MHQDAVVCYLREQFVPCGDGLLGAQVEGGVPFGVADVQGMEECVAAAQ